MDNNILALDPGGRRVGVAIASLAARLPAPLTTITSEDQAEAAAKLAREHNAAAVVVGLPRSMNGSDSAQTEEAKRFAEELGELVEVPVFLQDESVTSIRAEEELKSRGKPYSKEDIDALSATYILEDFLSSPSARDKLEGRI